jgi:hypothetical protein
MELDELKNLWQADDKNLDSRIRLNNTQLMKMNMENATGEFSKIINISLLGRNMALVYCFISIGMAIFMIGAIEYSVPAIFGGMAMLWSFISHLSIEKPDYNDSIVQLQKTICKFRIHLAANAKYDIFIVALWVLSIVPIFIKIVYNVSLYNSNKALAIFCLVGCVALSLMIALSRKAYAEYDRTLKKSEAHLAELIKFETKSLHD